MPNPKNAQHIQELRESMEELNLPNKVIYQVIKNLINEEDIVKNKKSGNTYVVQKHNKKTQTLIKKDASADDIEKVKKGDDKKEDDTKPTTTSGVSSESIDAIDGDAKNKTLSGEEPPPGTESSAVAEIGVGFGMGCLSENNNDMEAAEKCLEEKLSKSKLGAKHGTGSGKKEMRRGMLQSAKRENQKVREINEELGWENSKTAHLGGSQASLKASVDKLKELGIKEVNGMPIDEYEKIILGGGGGENPTDTMVCVVNEETGEAIMYHTSNKMTSKDQIANGSPAKEIREVVSLA